jgi:hypothetical protein
MSSFTAAKSPLRTKEKRIVSPFTSRKLKFALAFIRSFAPMRFKFFEATRGGVSLSQFLISSLAPEEIRVSSASAFLA